MRPAISLGPFRVGVPLTWSGLLISFLYPMLGVWDDIIGQWCTW